VSAAKRRRAADNETQGREGRLRHDDVVGMPGTAGAGVARTERRGGAGFWLRLGVGKESVGFEVVRASGRFLFGERAQMNTQ